MYLAVIGYSEACRPSQHHITAAAARSVLGLQQHLRSPLPPRLQVRLFVRLLRLFLRDLEAGPEGAVIEHGADRRAHHGPHDVCPEPAPGPRNGLLAVNERGHDAGAKVPGRVEAALGNGGVHGHQAGHSEPDEVGGHLLGCQRGLPLVRQGQDHEHEDAGAPCLDAAGVEGGDDARVQPEETRVGEVLAKGHGGQDALLVAPIDSVLVFKVFDQIVEGQIVHKAPNNAPEHLGQHVSAALSP
mmetsp:Transcript_23487/g.40369  ORF Transcript_23487/g.40369 Transcript_23487/m.40369 type:complete len:243 (+) Transcript_23487:528-1256(+)